MAIIIIEQEVAVSLGPTPFWWHSLLGRQQRGLRWHQRTLLKGCMQATFKTQTKKYAKSLIDFNQQSIDFHLNIHQTTSP